ncbi:salicylate hydroxylase [Marasmius fiardii PR-910]|nr:salicylate hydroxylase [Marasmius fiardii PR-910]
MMQASKFRVAICGGGIGGLVHACALAKFSSISVSIYERGSEVSTLGAGIGMWPRTWEILRKLGLAEELKKVSLCFPAQDESLAFSFRKSNQRKGFEFFSLRGGGSLMTFHRCDFQRTILAQLPSGPNCQMYYSKRLCSYSRSHDGTISLHFDDGTSHVCDVLVGADGIKSITRACMLREQATEARTRGRPPQEINALENCINPEFSGYVVYRSVAPREKLVENARDTPLPKSPVLYVGKDSYILAYPIALGQMVNLVLFDFKKESRGVSYPGHWSEVVDSDQVHNVSSFEHWEPQARAWLKCMKNPIKWAVHVVKPLPTFVSHNVVLLGDAAHASTPHQGTGAGQAIEDAYVLAELLGHPSTTRETIPRALRIYDSIRRPWTQKVAEKARVNGSHLTLDFEDFDFEDAPDDKVREQLERMGGIIIDNWSWSWNSSVQGDLEDAVRRLESED